MGSVATGHSTLNLTVTLNSQNQPGNFSSVHVKLWSQADSGFSGSSGTPIGYSVAVPSGGGASGSRSIPSSSTVVVWAEYDTNVGHDSSGHYSGTVTAHLNATGTATFGGPADVSQAVSLPRIPKKPSAPGITVTSNVGPTVTLNVTAPADDGGSTITNYAVEYSKNGGPWVGTQLGSTGTRTFSGLQSGSYVFRAYAINAIGGGTTASTSAIAVHAGGYVWNGTAWVAALDTLVWNGTTWVSALGVYVWDGATWVIAL